MIAHAHYLATVLAFLIVSCGGGMPSVKTQPERRELLKPKIEENLRSALKCESATLSFVKTEDKGIEYYDLYIAEGCGQHTEYMTMVKVVGNDDQWAALQAAGPVPTQRDYEQASRAQLAKSAKFDLECDTVEFVELNALISPMRDEYEASIGATGCNKKSTYITKCAQTGYAAGKHELSCSSRITSADRKD